MGGGEGHEDQNEDDCHFHAGHLHFPEVSTNMLDCLTGGCTLYPVSGASGETG